MAMNPSAQRLVREGVTGQTADAVASAVKAVMTLSINHRVHSNPPLLGDPSQPDVVSFLTDCGAAGPDATAMHHIDMSTEQQVSSAAPAEPLRVVDVSSVQHQHWEFSCSSIGTLSQSPNTAHTFSPMTADAVRAALAGKPIEAGDALAAAVLEAYNAFFFTARKATAVFIHKL